MQGRLAASLLPRRIALALFYIQLRDDTHVREQLPVEAESISEARLEVAKFVGEMLKFQAADIWVDRDWRIDLTDASGLILYYMQVFVGEAASTMSSSVKAD